MLSSILAIVFVLRLCRKSDRYAPELIIFLRLFYNKVSLIVRPLVSCLILNNHQALKNLAFIQIL